MSSLTPNAHGIDHQSEPDYWPTDGWRTSSPEAQGMNSELLNQLLAHLNAYDYCYNSFIVVRHGYIVFETYPNPIYDQNSIHFIASVTKSVMSGIFGIAVDQGYINSIHDSVLSYFPNRTIDNLCTLKEMMTVRDLLTMKTGIQWDEGTYSYDDPRNSFIQWVNSPDGVQHFLDLPMECAPNLKWYYNTGASSMLSALVTSTSGDAALDFAIEHLFQPLGITRYSWLADSHGINYGGFGMSLLPRDMAKYGFLFLQNGQWDGQQIISTSWIAESTSTHTVFYPGYGYGYHWITFPMFNGYAAFGAGGQGIFVSPKYDLVVVVTAEEPEGVPFLGLILSHIIPALYEVEPALQIQWTVIWVLTLCNGVAIPVFFLYWFKRGQRDRSSLLDIENSSS